MTISLELVKHQSEPTEIRYSTFLRLSISEIYGSHPRRTRTTQARSQCPSNRHRQATGCSRIKSRQSLRPKANLASPKMCFTKQRTLARVHSKNARKPMKMYLTTVSTQTNLPSSKWPFLFISTIECVLQ